MSIPPRAADSVGAAERRGEYDVKDFGAAGDGKTDDTSAIQKAIDLARQTGNTVYLPPGMYSVRSLDMTIKGRGFVFRGAGGAGTTLLARENTNCVIDLTGSYYMKLQDFMLRTADGITPKTAFFLGQPKQGVSGNLINLDNVHVQGNYTVASFYCHCICSSTIVRCTFWNTHPGEVAVVAFTKNNYAGLKSEFLESLPREAGNCSDWTITGSEIHHLAPGTEATSATAVVLDDTMQMRWFGGNISCEGPQLFRFDGDNRNITIAGTTIYTELGHLPGVTFRNNGKLRSFSVGECFLQASNAIFAGGSDSLFEEITFHSKPTVASPGSVRLIDAPGSTVSDSMLHCDGLGLRAGTIRDCFLIRPGKIEAKESGVIKTSSQ